MAYRNQHYWNKKAQMAQQAKAHDAVMKQYFCDFTKDNCSSDIFSQTISLPDDSQPSSIYLAVQNLDSVAALFAYANDKTAVLNFASYKEPGGRFLDGSTAQEESLCHASNLYEVLASHPDFYEWNNEHKNKALYTNRAIYSHNVRFFPADSTPSADMPAAKIEECRAASILADVITCACPNKYTAQKYCNVSDEQNSEVLQNRIRFVLDVAEAEQVKTLILGAYGCGVFAQSPAEVAQIFRDELFSGRYHFDTVIFAIPGGDNLTAFNDIFYQDVPFEH